MLCKKKDADSNHKFSRKKLLYTCCALCCEISLAPCPANLKGVIQKMHLEFIAEADDSKSETHRKCQVLYISLCPLKEVNIMLNFLKKENNFTYTENGALTH